jgi:hypothetical protein
MTITLPYIFYPGETMYASQMNANFSILTTTANETNNILSYGGIADANLTTTAVSMAVGSSTLSVSTSIFATTDVGKRIYVMRQDISMGFSPWYNNTSTGYTIVPTITSFISPLQVVLNTTGSSSPSGLGTTFPSQTWPYSLVNSIVAWGSDNTTALQTALNQNGSVYIPNGNFAFAGQIVMSSNNTIYGNGPGSNLIPLGIPMPTTSQLKGGFIVNSACNKYWSQYVMSPTIVPVPVTSLWSTIADSNITIRDIGIYQGCQGLLSGNSQINFYLIVHLLLTNVKITSTPNSFYQAPCFTSCKDVVYTHNDFENTGPGIYPWGGNQDVTISSNRITVPYNNSQAGIAAGGFQLGAIQINVVGTAAGDTQVSNNINILYNDIYLNGGNGAMADTYGIWIYPAGYNSCYKDAKVHGNNIYCSGGHNQPLLFEGGCFGLDVSNNYIEGASTSSPIIALQSGAGQTGNTSVYPSSVQSTIGSSIITVNWPGHNIYSSTYSTYPTYFYATGGAPTVGGIGTTGYFPIVNIPNNNTFMIQTQGTAASTQLVSWNGTYTEVDIPVIGASVTGNIFKDCSTTNNLINGSMIGGQINNNIASYSTGTLVGSYNSMIYISGFNNTPSSYVLNNIGPIGTISPSVGQTGRVTWNIYEPTPTVVDPQYPLSSFSGTLIASNAQVTNTLTANTLNVLSSGGSVVVFGDSATTAGTLRFANAGGSNYIQSAINTTYLSTAPLIFSGMLGSPILATISTLGMSTSAVSISGALNAANGSFSGTLTSGTITTKSQIISGSISIQSPTGQNICIGQNNPIIGTYNTVLGYNAGYSITANTVQNTAVGFSALYNSTGGWNTAFGVNALYGNTTGTFNTAFGLNAGNNATTLNNSIMIGYNTQPLNNAGDTNEIVIGYSTTGLGSNTTNIGNSSTTLTQVYGNMTITGTRHTFGNGVTWVTGSGAPTLTLSSSSIYSRSDGTIGTHMYISNGGGSWTAVTGV